MLIYSRYLNFDTLSSTVILKECVTSQECWVVPQCIFSTDLVSLWNVWRQGYLVIFLAQECKVLVTFKLWLSDILISISLDFMECVVFYVRERNAEETINTWMQRFSYIIFTWNCNNFIQEENFGVKKKFIHNQLIYNFSLASRCYNWTAVVWHLKYMFKKQAFHC